MTRRYSCAVVSGRPVRAPSPSRCSPRRRCRPSAPRPCGRRPPRPLRQRHQSRTPPPRHRIADLARRVLQGLRIARHDGDPGPLGSEHPGHRAPHAARCPRHHHHPSVEALHDLGRWGAVREVAWEPTHFHLHSNVEPSQAPVRSDRVQPSRPSVAPSPRVAGAPWPPSTLHDREDPMPTSVSSYLLRRLTDWGVRRVFGYPGRRHQRHHGRASAAPTTSSSSSRSRHEEMAAFMACAHAKFTGEVGRLPGDLGPGRHPPAQRALRREDGPPAGGRHRRPAGRARRWAATTSRRSTCSRSSRTWPTSTCQMAQRRRRSGTSSTARSASRCAERTVTCIIVPNDVQELEAVEQPPRTSTAPSTPASATTAPRVVPTEEDLQRAADVLNAGQQGGDAGRRGRAAAPRTR